MTASPSETADLTEFAERVAEAVGATSWSADFGTVKVTVDRDRWLDALRTARDELGLDFFSFLSAIDWARDRAVGDAPEDPQAIEERFEVICRLSTVVDASAVVLAANLAKSDAMIDSAVELFPGASWHEREAHEMFGIDFRGHPNLEHLYLPDAFEGHPLLKSYPLLSREVKPWPGTVDVEDMPATENPEAGDAPEPEAEGET